MKVAFNCRLLREPTLRGWNRYAINLLIELAALDVKLFLYSDHPIHEDHLKRLPADTCITRQSGPMGYFSWQERWLPRQCAADGVDILHCPMNFGLPWHSRCKRILTLHDAIDSVYDQGSIPWRQRLAPATLKSRFYHWQSRARAHHVITVSNHAKGDLVRHLKIPREKISVTYEGADPIFHQPITPADIQRVQNTHAIADPYIFYIGGWEKRKNLPFLIRAFAAANVPGVKLLLAGGREEQRAPILALTDSLSIRDRIHLLNWVEDADLPALYAGALCFVYPSEYEGFGLQLCEAMATGCPTLAANATCLPEVLGDGGVTFGLDDPGNLAVLLRRVYEDRVYRDQLASQACIRSANFSWRKTAAQTLEIYKQACQNL